jgi:low temperature requirement protein LtrA
MPVLGRDPAVWTLLRPPRLRTLDDGEERHASWLELFFDLVFVVAIAQLASELVEDHTLGGFARFVGLFLPVFIAWQGFTIYADRFDTDDLVFRGVMFVGMLAIAALAVQISDVVDGDSTGFAVAYVVLRSLMIALYLRSYRHVPEARPLIVRYSAGYSLGIGVWLLSLAFPSPARFVLWGVALAWEYSLPVLFRRWHASIPVHASHLPERFALFTLIVLGESIVAVALGTAHTDWQPASAITAALGFVIAVAIWWTYFGTGTGTGLELHRSTRAILAFAHVHIPLLAALTVVSAGISLAIEQAPSDHLDTGSRWALCGGAAVFLACVTATQRATLRGISRRKATARGLAGLALVVLALAATGVDPLLVTASSAAVLLALVAFEMWSYQRSLAGMPAALGTGDVEGRRGAAAF